MAHKRLTRDEMKTVTRTRLLEAAARVFAQRGFHAASVEEVAREAGFSKGAVYSNFEGKEELLLALLEAQSEARMAEVNDLFEHGDSVEMRLLEGGRGVTRLIERDREWFLLYIEFWAYAVRNPRLRKRFAEHTQTWRAGIADLIARQTEAMDMELPVPAEDLVSMVLALGDGFVIQKLADPGRFAEDSYGGMLLLLFGGLAALAARDEAGVVGPGQPFPSGG